MPIPHPTSSTLEPMWGRKQLEDVGLVPPGLAHRLEIVGGVLFLGLGESVVDVHI